MSSTDSTRFRRIVFSLTDHCDGEFLYPPCRFESWAMLQHCGGSYARMCWFEVSIQVQKPSHWRICLQFKRVWCYAQKPQFQVLWCSLSIRFNDGTSFDKLPESTRPIPTELFWLLRAYNQLLELANTGKNRSLVCIFSLSCLVGFSRIMCWLNLMNSFFQTWLVS